MTKKTMPTENYINQMDMLLGKVSAAIEKRLASLENPGDIEHIDAYVHELNSFYYRSFHEQFFPFYRQSIQEETTRLLNLSIQEDTLKQGILNSIKRYAQLYNQVKKLAGTLNASKDSAYQQILALNHEQDLRSIELFYSLKQWQEHVQALAACSEQLAEILGDQDLRARLERNPALLAVLQLLDSLDLNQPLSGAGFNTLLSNLRFGYNLVSQMQKEKNPGSANLHYIKEIQTRPLDTTREKLPAVLLRFYQSFLLERINAGVEPLEFYLQASDYDLYNKNLRFLGQFLEDVIVLLEKGQHYVLSGHRTLLSQAFHGPQVPAGVMNRLIQGSGQILTGLAELGKQFSPPEEPDFDYFSQQSRLLLEQAGQLMDESVQTDSLHRVGPLSTHLHRANFELQYLLRWLDFLKQEAGQRSELLAALLNVVNTLDAFLNLLGTIRADLERMLAPRNLSRLWKNYTIRVDRFPLEKNKPFPAQYLHLLEGVERRGGCQDENIVLLEEGDLFIIRVDDEHYEEIPYMIVSKKG